MTIKKIVKNLKIHKLPIYAIEADRLQPRQNFSQRDIDVLAEDIAERGQIEPIMVTEGEEEGTYIVQSGERRLRACKQAGLDTIEAAIVKFDEPLEMYEVQFVANGNRTNPNIQEMAKALERYVNRYKTLEPEAKRSEIIKRLCRMTGYSSTYFNQVQAILDIKDTVLRKMIDDRKVGGYFPAEVNSAVKDEELRSGLYAGMKTIVKSGKKTTALSPRFLKHKLNQEHVLNLDPQGRKEYARTEFLKAVGVTNTNTKGNFDAYKAIVIDFQKEVEDWVMNGLEEDEALQLASMIQNISSLVDAKRETHFGRLKGRG